MSIHFYGCFFICNSREVRIIEIFRLMGSIFIDTKDAEKSVSKTDGLVKKLGKGLGNGIKTAAKWGVGLATAAAGAATAAFAATNKITQGFDKIAKHSTKLGVSTDAYQEMSYWASQNGIEASQMERAVGRLNQRIGLAAEGNKKYSGALEKLGIDMEGVKDGTVSTEDAMYQAMSALSQLSSEQEKSAMASELFGTKLARELMPALQDNSMTMDDAKEAAERLGIVIGEDTIKAGVSFQDNLTDMKASLGAVGQNIIAYLIPVFNRMTDWILDNMPKIQEIAGKVFDFISKVVTTVVEVVRDHFIPALVRLWEWIEPYLPEIKQFFKDAFEMAKDVIDDATDTIKKAIDWVKEYWHILEPILIGVGAGVAVFIAIQGAIALYNTVTSIATGVTGAFGAVLAFITSPIGIVTLAIGALVAIGVVLYRNWDKITEVAKSMWQNIKTTFDNIKKKVSEVFGSIKDTMLKPFESARDGVKKVIDKIRGFLNFKWELPKIKMPKFSVKGSANPLKWLSEGVPKLSVKWNKDGAIFKQPTIFDTRAGLQGVGDARTPEVVAPLHKLKDMLELDDKPQSIENHFKISSLVVREEADIEKIAQGLLKLQERNRRGKGVYA